MVWHVPYLPGFVHPGMRVVLDPQIPPSGSYFHSLFCYLLCRGGQFAVVPDPRVGCTACALCSSSMSVHTFAPAASFVRLSLPALDATATGRRTCPDKAAVRTVTVSVQAQDRSGRFSTTGLATPPTGSFEPLSSLASVTKSCWSACSSVLPLPVEAAGVPHAHILSGWSVVVSSSGFGSLASMTASIRRITGPADKPPHPLTLALF